MTTVGDSAILLEVGRSTIGTPFFIGVNQRSHDLARLCVFAVKLADTATQSCGISRYLFFLLMDIKKRYLAICSVALSISSRGLSTSCEALNGESG